MGNAEVTVTVTFTEDQAKAWLDGVAYARLRGHGGAELPENVEDLMFEQVYEAVYDADVLVGT